MCGRQIPGVPVHRFAIGLNEISPDVAGAPITDARFRPDKNCMETADWDGANELKSILEEKQRERRRAREKAKQAYQARWFRLASDPVIPNQHFMDVKSGNEVVGHVTRYCWSPRLEHNIALVNVPTSLSEPGTALSLDSGDGWREATVVNIPWFPAEKVIPQFD